jgi:excisionase family DNA binding protein
MLPNPLNQPDRGDEALLRPREVAALFGVRPSTIARWAREGKLTPLLTPGGHRRYRLADIREMLLSDEPEEDDVMAQDAVRLYEQGWNIRQVADRFECSYGVMRRILSSRITLRSRGGRPPAW